MENTNNIIIMLNKIENTLNVLTRRVSELEGRVNVTQPMGVNQFYNPNPFNTSRQMPGFMSNETHGLHGNNSKRPQCKPQYNHQYRPQYIVSKSVEELNSIKLCLINHFTNCAKQGLATNDNSVFDKIAAIERILLQGLNNLQHNYNVYPYIDSNLIMISKGVSDIYSKHCFNRGITQSDISNLNALKLNIEMFANYWNIKTINTSNVNNSYTAQPVGKENLSDMEKWANNTGFKFQQSPMCNINSDYRTYSSRPLDPIIDTIVDTLTNKYKINLTLFKKNALYMLKSLDSIPEDIYNHVTSLHLHVTQYKSMPEIFMPLLTSICDMMFDRGYMKSECKLSETVNDEPMNSVENIESVDQDSNIKKPTNDNTNINKSDIINAIKNVKHRLLILPIYTDDHGLNMCVNLLNKYLIINYSELDSNIEITEKHVSCNYLANELLRILDSYNTPDIYIHGRYINNLDKLVTDLNKLIKDYNVINTLNQDNKPVVSKPKRQQVRKR